MESDLTGSRKVFVNPSPAILDEHGLPVRFQVSSSHVLYRLVVLNLTVGHFLRSQSMQSTGAIGRCTRCRGALCVLHLYLGRTPSTLDNEWADLRFSLTFTPVLHPGSSRQEIFVLSQVGIPLEMTSRRRIHTFLIGRPQSLLELFWNPYIQNDIRKLDLL